MLAPCFARDRPDMMRGRDTGLRHASQVLTAPKSVKKSSMGVDSGQTNSEGLRHFQIPLKNSLTFVSIGIMELCKCPD